MKRCGGGKVRPKHGGTDSLNYFRRTLFLNFDTFSITVPLFPHNPHLNTSLFTHGTGENGPSTYEVSMIMDPTDFGPCH